MNELEEVPLNRYSGVTIECPNCDSSNYSLSSEEYDDEWIYVDYKCEDCQYKFRASFRAISIEDTEEFMESG
jgi:transposase-like protein